MRLWAVLEPRPQGLAYLGRLSKDVDQGCKQPAKYHQISMIISTLSTIQRIPRTFLEARYLSFGGHFVVYDNVFAGAKCPHPVPGILLLWMTWQDCQWVNWKVPQQRISGFGLWCCFSWRPGSETSSVEMDKNQDDVGSWSLVKMLSPLQVKWGVSQTREFISSYFILFLCLILSSLSSPKFLNPGHHPITDFADFADFRRYFGPWEDVEIIRSVLGCSPSRTHLCGHKRSISLPLRRVPWILLLYLLWLDPWCSMILWFMIFCGQVFQDFSKLPGNSGFCMISLFVPETWLHISLLGWLAASCSPPGCRGSESDRRDRYTFAGSQQCAEGRILVGQYWATTGTDLVNSCHLPSHTHTDQGQTDSQGRVLHNSW